MKKEIVLLKDLKRILNNSNRKPNKVWLDNGKEFYNNRFKKFLKNNDIEMHSTFNEGKPVIAERFIKTLKNKIYKHMTYIGENVYYNVLDGIVKNYNNTIHNSIKVKPKDVKNNSLTEYIEEFNKRDPKCKIGDYVRISKHKNIFSKGYLRNWSEEIFIINKIRNTVPWTYLIIDLKGEEIKGSFIKKNCKRLIKKNLEWKK